jgi:glutaredoxin-related protein
MRTKQLLACLVFKAASVLVVLWLGGGERFPPCFVVFPLPALTVHDTRKQHVVDLVRWLPNSHNKQQFSGVSSWKTIPPPPPKWTWSLNVPLGKFSK